MILTAALDLERLSLDMSGCTIRLWAEKSAEERAKVRERVMALLRESTAQIQAARVE